MKPLCFVIMPFGVRRGHGGATIDFGAVYSDLVAPSIAGAGLEPLRADEERAGGMIAKRKYERLVLCEYAVADLTTADANVFYDLGLRHAVQPRGTLVIFAASGTPLPFDVGPLRGLPYTLGADGKPARVEDDRAALVERLMAARTRDADSPVFQLLDGFPDIQRLKTDVFRERADYSRQMKERLAVARKRGVDALGAIERELAAQPGGLRDAEAGVVIDLFLSYRSVRAWAEMIALTANMSPPIAATPLVREQLGLALNRAGQSEKAERVLLDLVADRGPSSETWGILGRVYKDRWRRAVTSGEEPAARGLLSKAVNVYLQGYEADLRDAYPGVNAVTLMELCDPPDPRRLQLVPVVAYAVQRRIAAGKPDYWDHATRLELAVLARDRTEAESALKDALLSVREKWEPEMTARNLRLIADARTRRGDALEWTAALERRLLKASRKNETT